jgi:hypothetical protein
MSESMKVLENDIGERPIYLKLRPNQQEQDSIWIKYLKIHQVNYQILPKKLVLEELFLDSENCKVIGTVSALLFYASIFGHEAFSNYALIPQKPKSVFDYLDFYWEKVIKF